MLGTGIFNICSGFCVLIVMVHAQVSSIEMAMGIMFTWVCLASGAYYINKWANRRG